MSSVHGRSRGNVGEVFVARRMATEREERVTTGRGPHYLAEVAEDLGEDGVALLAAASVDELRRLLLSFGPHRTTCVDAELLLHAHHTEPGARPSLAS